MKRIMGVYFIAIFFVFSMFTGLAFAQDVSSDKSKAQRVDLGDEPDARPDNEIGYGEEADQPAFSGQDYGFGDPMDADSGPAVGKIDEED